MNPRLDTARTSILGAVAALAAIAAPGHAQSPLVMPAQPPPAETVVRAAAPISWLKSFEAARGSARPDQVIVVDVSTDWCTWCRYMETQIYPSQPVSEFASGNVFVRIDPKDGGEGAAFAKKQKIKAYPTIFVFSPSGKLLQKQVGAFDSGPNFAAWLRTAAARR